MDNDPKKEVAHKDEAAVNPAAAGQASGADRAERGEKSERGERAEKLTVEKPEKPGRPERAERVERAEKPEKPPTERPERAAERAERAEKAEMPQVERAEKAEKAERADKPEKAEKPDRAERVERAERPSAEKSERPDKAERPPGEKPGADKPATDRMDRPGLDKGERPERSPAAAQAAPVGDEAKPLPPFETGADESVPLEILNQRICDFDLKIEGRPLGKVIERFLKELKHRGITRVAPKFYLSDEWGVAEGTVAIGMPFYLADERLKRVQKVKGGIVEGTTADDILKYLRHEMGHVINYAYSLYISEEWSRLFGPMARPYTEEYRTLPFSPDYVRHLPGGYAQKHPDEDWAETFAVWMTPKLDWQEMYEDCPGALAKLEYCERMLLALRDKDPIVTSTEVEMDAQTISLTVAEYYQEIQLGDTVISRSLDGDLQAIFAFDSLPPAEEGTVRLGHAAALLKRQADPLANTVYRFTGVDPDLMHQLVTHLAGRAEELKLTYPLSNRDQILLELTGFLTTLAMNYVYKGNFLAKS